MKKDEKWQEAEERIYQIAEDMNQRPTPDHIVEDARSETSPLHVFFDWNDETAADAARRATARQLIRKVKFEISIAEETIAAPGFYRDPDLDYHDQGYVAYPIVKEDDGMALRVCLAEFDRTKSALNRAIISAKALGIDCEHGMKGLVFIEKMIKQLTA